MKENLNDARLSRHFTLGEFLHLGKYPENIPFFKSWEFTDQLLTGHGWLHISWNPFAPPRHFVRINYYK